MKRAFVILGSVAMLLIAGVVLVAWFALDSATKEINRLKTSAATRARWAKADPDPEAPEEKIVVRPDPPGETENKEKTETK